MRICIVLTQEMEFCVNTFLLTLDNRGQRDHDAFCYVRINEFSGGEEGKEIVTTYKMVDDTLKMISVEEIPF